MSKKKFYAVVAGRQPGLYDIWAGENGAEAQIKGFERAVFKSFQSRSEAVNWYIEHVGDAPTDYTTQPQTNEPVVDYLQIHQQALAEGKVVIYTDGGCKPNPGPGSYGVVLLYKERRKELSGGYQLTTNNRMELMGCIVALQALKQASRVVIFCDSSYVVDAMTKQWTTKWQAQHWQRQQGEQWVAVVNADLWQTLLNLCKYHTVTFEKVRGHAGSSENERCHQLATAALHQPNLPTDTGYQSEDDLFR